MSSASEMKEVYELAIKALVSEINVIENKLTALVLEKKAINEKIAKYRQAIKPGEQIAEEAFIKMYPYIGSLRVRQFINKSEQDCQNENLRCKKQVDEYDGEQARLNSPG